MELLEDFGKLLDQGFSVDFAVGIFGQNWQQFNFGGHHKVGQLGFA
jgi:hypothetical protein